MFFDSFPRSAQYQMIKQTRYWLLWFSFMVISQNAFALRCGSYVINEGMNKGEVTGKCGPASSVDSHIERRGTSNSIANQPRNFSPNSAFSYGQNNFTEVDIVVEEWIYNFGSSRLQQYLRFENGKLIEIRNLGYGY